MDRGSQLSKDDEDDEDDEDDKDDKDDKEDEEGEERRTRQEEAEEEEQEEEEEATDIKSNNPHLAGGEKVKPCHGPQRISLSISLSLFLSPHRHLVRYSTLFNAIYVLPFRMHPGNKQILP